MSIHIQLSGLRRDFKMVFTADAGQEEAMSSGTYIPHFHGELMMEFRNSVRKTINVKVNGEANVPKEAMEPEICVPGKKCVFNIRNGLSQYDKSRMAVYEIVIIIADHLSNN